MKRLIQWTYCSCVGGNVMSKSIDFADLNTAVSLAAMAVLNKLCPDAYQERAVRRWAALHIALHGSKSSQIDSPAIALDLHLDVRQLEQDFITGVYQEIVYTLREYQSCGWNPEIHLRGKHHIENALREGNGAVLWLFPSTFGGLVGRKGLHAARFELVMLSSHVHPYSGTRFGMRFLNPIRTRVENRYLFERVTLHPNADMVAMRRVLDLLGENKLVEIAAIGVSDAPASIPFLGGTLNLALGAPTIAAMSRAPLIPYFPIPVGNEKFDVYFEPPLEHRVASAPRDSAIRLARQYAAIMEKYVRKVPHVWRGWFSRTNWLPPE